jgi:hypothetical protein
MTGVSEKFLGYYYFGFHSALARYRVLTVEGWIVTAIGAAGLFVSWRESGDLMTIAVALSAVVAGVSIVQQSVASLDQYVRIPFPDPGSCPEEIAGGIGECARLMGEIDRGGWQEASAALGALGRMKERFSFPPLP